MTEVQQNCTHESLELLDGPIPYENPMHFVVKCEGCGLEMDEYYQVSAQSLFVKGTSEKVSAN